MRIKRWSIGRNHGDDSPQSSGLLEMLLRSGLVTLCAGDPSSSRSLSPFTSVLVLSPVSPLFIRLFLWRTPTYGSLRRDTQEVNGWRRTRLKHFNFTPEVDWWFGYGDVSWKSVSFRTMKAPAHAAVLRAGAISWSLRALIPAAQSRCRTLLPPQSCSSCCPFKVTLASSPHSPAVTPSP